MANDVYLDDVEPSTADLHEFFYWSTIQAIADIMLVEGRDKVMTDVAEAVMQRCKEDRQSLFMSDF